MLAAAFETVDPRDDPTITRSRPSTATRPNETGRPDQTHG